MTFRYRMGIGEWGMLLGLSVLWGGSFFFNRLALRELPPLTVVMLRVGLGALAMWLLLLLSVSFPTGRRLWSAFMLMGLLNNVIPFTLIVWGQLHIASGLAAILNATTPLFSLLVGWLGVGGTAGKAAARGGGNRIRRGSRHDRSWPVGGGPQQPGGAVGGTGRGAVLCLRRRLRPSFCRHGPQSTAHRLRPGQRLGAGAATVIVTCRPAVDLTASAWDHLGAIAGLALLSTALAYVLFFQLLARAGTLNLMLVTFLIPVSATLLGGLVLHERLQGTELAGMAIILLALLIIDGRLGRRLFRRGE